MALFARACANAALLTNNCYLIKLTSQDVKLRSFVGYTKKFSAGKKVSKCSSLGYSAPRTNITYNSQRYFVRKCHTIPYNANYVPYGEVLDRRRQEASKSILVQVQSSNSSVELYNYCKQFGEVKVMHHYTIKDNQHFFLIEFDKWESAHAALESATHLNYNEVIPVQSPMLWFRNARNTSTKGNIKSTISPSVEMTINGSTIPKTDELNDRLMSSESISEQMVLLHEAWKLDEVGIRLRFLTAHQVERSFVGLFPRSTVYPFGSSVNGFGKQGCDLDLVFSLETNSTEKETSRLVYHTKAISSISKAQSKKLLETIADCMQNCIPGVTNVRRILMARVPIIKYDQALTGLECDLCVTNVAAVYMSELLCLYGEIDSRVRPLVFTIRQWATKVGLTNRSPGRWITNFSLTLLVLFYLQQRQILPSLNTLKSLAGQEDVRLADHSLDCTFLRDIRKLPKGTENTDSLETLLCGFFEFYSTFDFAAKAVSLREGTSIFKPDHSPLYICNPLEVALNVSKNVNIEETERFKVALRNASWQLETAGDGKTGKSGLLSIFENLDVISYVDGKRIVNFAAIFKVAHDKNTEKTPKTPVNQSPTEFVRKQSNRKERVTKQRWR